MSLRVAIPCVNYSDFLRLTLPHAVREFGHVTVLTSVGDDLTCEIADMNGARCVCSQAWYSNGATFGKARVLNEWLDTVDNGDPDLWVLMLDADILVPHHISRSFNCLDSRVLYSVERRMCETQSEWNDFASGLRKWDSFHINTPPVIGGRVWGRRESQNPAGLCGYLLLWNVTQWKGLHRFPETPTAKEYDVLFGLSQPENLREFLPGVSVLHLGRSKVNWEGRVSEHWAAAIQCGIPQTVNVT